MGRKSKRPVLSQSGRYFRLTAAGVHIFCIQSDRCCLQATGAKAVGKKRPVYSEKNIKPLQ